MVGSPCSPRDSQEYSPILQFKASILWCSAFLIVQLTSIHDYWKNQSFDQMDLCWRNGVSVFKYTVLVCHSFSSKEQVSFNFTNHPQTIPLTWSMEKVSSTKPVPGAQKFGDDCSKKRKNHRQYTCPKGLLYEKITVRQWPPLARGESFGRTQLMAP